MSTRKEEAWYRLKRLMVTYDKMGELEAVDEMLSTILHYYNRGYNVATRRCLEDVKGQYKIIDRGRSLKHEFARHALLMAEDKIEKRVEKEKEVKENESTTGTPL
jgi:hypothetical protein